MLMGNGDDVNGGFSDTIHERKRKTPHRQTSEAGTVLSADFRVSDDQMKRSLNFVGKSHPQAVNALLIEQRSFFKFGTSLRMKYRFNHRSL